MPTGKLAGLFAVLAGCVSPLAHEQRSEPQIAVGGSSPLVGAIERVAADTGVPAELLATMAHLGTRFQIPTSEAHAHGREAIGIFGLDPDSVARGARLAGVTDAAARTEIEAGLRAGAALLRQAAPSATTLAGFVDALEPNLARSVRRSLARGVDGRDAAGGTIVIAARGTGYEWFDAAEPAPGYPEASWHPASPENYSVGNRGPGDITNIVIHTVQGSFSSCINWFQNPDASVSAHYVVRSEDGHVAQMVDEKNVAWHDKCFNAKTIGIEHEGFIDKPELWYTEAMYMESAKLTAYLADKYGLAKEKGVIVGHDTAPDCSTHTDPGSGWDWDHFIELVQSYGTPQFAAEDVVIDAPATLVSGERATVTITVTNRGKAAWEPDLTRLGTTLPQDRESELFVDGDWLSPSRATSIDVRVAPGETGTFTFDIVAPVVSEPRLFDEAFQLVEEDVTWFGPDIHLMVEVTPADSGGCSTSNHAGTGSLLALLGLFLVRRRRS